MATYTSHRLIMEKSGNCKFLLSRWRYLNFISNRTNGRAKHTRAANSTVRGRIWLKFEPIRDIIVVLVTCKNEEDPLKKIMALEWPQHFSHLKSMGIFPDAQGQLTPQSEVEPGRNSNSSEMLWLSLSPARMKKILSKMKLLEWPQHFPHYNSMGAICCHGNQNSDPTWPKT